MNKKNFLSAVSALLAIAIFISSAGLVLAQWQEPRVAPPQGNPAPPLDVSDQPQTKAGSLDVSDTISAGADDSRKIKISGSDLGVQFFNNGVVGGSILLNQNNLRFNAGDGFFIFQKPRGSSLAINASGENLTFELGARRVPQGEEILANGVFNFKGDINVTGGYLVDGQPLQAGGGESLWQAAENPNNIYYSGGNVGIGVANPIAPLQVGNSLTVSGNNQTLIGQNFKYEDNQSKRVREGGSSLLTLGNDGAVSLKNTPSGAANSVIEWNNALYVNNNGNVGIGTTNPTNKLTIFGGNAQIQNGNLYFTSDYAGAPSAIRTIVATVGGGLARGTYNYIGTYVTRYGGETAAGNRPGVACTLNGNGRCKIYLEIMGDDELIEKIKIYRTTGLADNVGGYRLIGEAEGFVIANLSRDNGGYYIEDSGLAVRGGSPPTYDTTTSGIYVNDNPVIRFHRVGDVNTIRVGIGTDAPQYTLDINGSIKFSSGTGILNNLGVSNLTIGPSDANNGIFYVKGNPANWIGMSMKDMSNNEKWFAGVNSNDLVFRRNGNLDDVIIDSDTGEVKISNDLNVLGDLKTKSVWLKIKWVHDGEKIEVEHGTRSIVPVNAAGNDDWIVEAFAKNDGGKIYLGLVAFSSPEAPYNVYTERCYVGGRINANTGVINWGQGNNAENISCDYRVNNVIYGRAEAIFDGLKLTINSYSMTQEGPQLVLTTTQSF